MSVPVVIRFTHTAARGDATIQLPFTKRVLPRTVAATGFLPNPTPTKPTYPVLYVAGRKVKTDAGTKFRWSDGTALDAAQIRTGDQAYVEGWGLPEGYVEATRLVIDCR